MAGTITAIRVQKKNPKRANLYLDGKFVLGLSIDIVQDWGLRRGMSLSEAEMEALQRAEGQHRALGDALRLLNYRPRSLAEVRQRLRDRGYEPEQVDATVQRLQEVGLLDDRAFAQAWLEHRELGNPRGSHGLAAELRQKGIASELIAEALAGHVDGNREEAQALELARDRARALSGLERPAFFRRLQGYLARRGFAAAVVVQTVRQVWEETARHAEEEGQPEGQD